MCHVISWHPCLHTLCSRHSETARSEYLTPSQSSLVAAYQPLPKLHHLSGGDGVMYGDDEELGLDQVFCTWQAQTANVNRYDRKSRQWHG
jgi:hypothetical protein